MGSDASVLLPQPFLKWAGGKRWLAERLAPAFAELLGTYLEPFLGSGAVFFRYTPKKAVLSDANAELIECYLRIKDDHAGVEGALRELAKKSPDDAYYDVRQSRPETPNERAARFLYLNRTCWNGLYRVNLRGEFNVPRGTKTDILLPTDDFSAVSAALQHAEIRSNDFSEIIESAKSGDLIFADPPYTVAHNTNGFIKYNQNIFSWSDQKRLAECLVQAAKRGAIVIATNADHPEVRDLYRDFEHCLSLSRASVIAASASNRRSTTELLVTNGNLGALL
jgi:DNA adenine methylase